MAEQNEELRIGEVLEALSETIHERWDSTPDVSWTAKLLKGPEDKLLKKVSEEACEVIMAAKDNDVEHLCYEAGDLVYHLLVVLERYGVSLSDLAATLESRTGMSGIQEKASRPKE